MKNIHIQTGGNQPNVKLLKDINLFLPESLEELHLNPTWGYIWLNTGILVNYKFLNIPDDSNLNKFINKFIQVIDINNKSIVTNENPKPTNLIKDNLLPNKLVGNYLALKYLITTDKFKFAVETLKLINTNKILKSAKIKKIFKDSHGIHKFFLSNSDIKTSLLNKYPLISYDNFERDWFIVGDSIKLLMINKINEDKLLKSNKIDYYINNLSKKLFEYNFIDSVENRYLEKELEKKLNQYLSDIDRKMKNLKDYQHPNNARYKPFTEFEKRWVDNDERYFYVILAIMWFNSTSKNDIKDYYIGLYEYNINFNIPHNWDVWTSSIYSKELNLTVSETNTYLMKVENYEPQLFNQLLAIFHINYKNPFTIIDYKYVNLSGKVTYPDCGASSLRDFLRILILETNNTYNLELLSYMGAKSYVIKFFELFNEEDQKLEDDAGKKNIKSIKDLLKGDGIEHVDTFLEEDINNSRVVWGFITSNIVNVDYRKSYNESTNMFEISSDNGVYNILNVIKGLFDNINEWSDFEEIITEYGSEYNQITLEENLDDQFGHILIIKDSGIFKYHFRNGHFNISFESSQNIDINFNELVETKKLTKEQVFYLKMLTFNIEEINLLFYPFNIYFFKFSNNIQLIDLFKKYYHNTSYFKDSISKNDYNNLLTSIKYFNLDELSRTYLDVFNLNNDIILGSKYLSNINDELAFNNVHLEIYIEEEKCDCDYSELIKGNCDICYFSLDNIHNIEFIFMENERLNNSLKIFKNLTSIIFPYGFNNGNTLLGDNFNKLEHLVYYAPIKSEIEINSVLQNQNLNSVYLNITYEIGKILESKDIEVTYYLNNNISSTDGKEIIIKGSDINIFNELINKKKDNKYIFYNNAEHLIINIQDKYQGYTTSGSNDNIMSFKQFIINLKNLKKITIENLIFYKYEISYINKLEQSIFDIYKKLANLVELEITNFHKKSKTKRYIKTESGIKEDFLLKYLKYKKKYLNIKNYSLSIQI
jgi:hypothetical protein